MAAKGSIAKEQILKMILALFDKESSISAFSPDNKEIRVDVIENGNPVQIKITLTAVKVPISNSPESKIINEEQFFISDDENEELKNTLKEMGVSF